MNELSGAAITITGTDGTNSDNSVADTLGLMAGHVNRAIASPQIAKALLDAGVNRNQDEDEKISKIFRFLKSKVRFIEDEKQLAEIFAEAHPNGRELLIRPEVLLSMNRPQGDCDDFSMLGCSMLRAVGVRTDFVTVAADSNSPGVWSHVFCQVTKQDGSKVAFDASHGDYVGWETNKQGRRQVWPVMDWSEVMGTVNTNCGCGGLGTDQVTDFNLDTYSGQALPSSPSFMNTFLNLLPGIATAGEKIALQVTQKPGYQQVGPQGSVSYVAGPGTTGVLNIPGTSIGSSSNSLIWILGIGLAAFALARMSK